MRLALMLIAVAAALFATDTHARLTCGAPTIDDGLRCLSPSLAGRVVGISDGDTVTLLDDKNTQTKIRLAYIDAPESSQAFGQVSRQKLSDVCFNKQASAAKVDTDKYGRVVAVLMCNGQNANRTQIEAGLAWVYQRYAPAGTYWGALELDARRAQRGLWIDKHPTPPWEFRKEKKGAQ